jgi:hypothetical protein
LAGSLKAIGAASDRQQWACNCYVHGRPSSADDSGTGHESDDAKVKRHADKAWRSYVVKERTTTPRYSPACEAVRNVIGGASKVVNSGVVRVMELQEKGWSYVKP